MMMKKNNKVQHKNTETREIRDGMEEEEI
jgi:hypothetical protein